MYKYLIRIIEKIVDILKVEFLPANYRVLILGQIVIGVFLLATIITVAGVIILFV